MFARGETEEKMGAGFPLVECQQFLPRPKLPPPAQASAAHKIPEKEAFFRQNWIFSFSDGRFLRCHCLIPCQSKVLEMRRPSQKPLCHSS